jgi:hypothetical protein
MARHLPGLHGRPPHQRARKVALRGRRRSRHPPPRPAPSYLTQRPTRRRARIQHPHQALTARQQYHRRGLLGAFKEERSGYSDVNLVYDMVRDLQHLPAHASAIEARRVRLGQQAKLSWTLSLPTPAGSLMLAGALLSTGWSIVPTRLVTR